MALTAGTKLGSYEVIAQIGAGGMGEVYRARDTRLDRIVAIKVLPAHLAHRSDLRDRFEREAKTIASLNHPHICTLFDTGRQDGTDFLVMEYLEGETLAQRLQKGPLPLDQVLQFAIEISDALDKAHRMGVTHRDLKPGNIMLTKSGTKLLDFGLAKLKQEAAPANVQLSELATLNDPLTAQGAIVGTLQYMAPEQLEGKEVDARTDIFAFGAVVYEMATGKRAFEGKSQASLIAKILETDPVPMTSLQPVTPPALERTVKRCMAKEPDDRWQTARDLEVPLKWIAEGGSQTGAAPAETAKGSRAAGRRGLISVAGALLAAAAVAGFAVWILKPSPISPPKVVTRFNIMPPPGQQFVNQETAAAVPTVAISPDGSNIAYEAIGSGNSLQLYLRPIGSVEARPIPDTNGGVAPFFSPDSQWLGFVSHEALMKVPLSGGSAVTLGSSQGSGAISWTSQGTILFGGIFAALQQIPESGGNPQPVIQLDKGEVGNDSPELLPGGKEILFSSSVGSGTGGTKISVRSLVSGERHDLISGNGSMPRYVPPGYLVYVQGGNLMAAPFDLKRLALTGPPVSMGENVLEQPSTGMAQYDVSASGTLVYIPASYHTPLKLTWVDRKGAEQPANAPPHTYVLPRISPDGRRITAGVEEGDSQIWIFDLDRDALSRLTLPGQPNVDPIWTPDGKRIVFKGAGNRLFWQLADGSAPAEQLTDAKLGTNNVPGSWSPDGQNMAFTYDVAKGRQIWIYSSKDRKVRPFEQNHAPYETAPRFSPDGHWMAYSSQESGRDEIYVRPFPGPGGKWQVSTDGGTEPVWNPKGRELFYREGKKMMVVEYEGQQTFSAGKPKELFEGAYVPTPRSFPDYDVSADGQRFLMLKPAEDLQSSSHLVVVVNWVEELKRKVPMGKN